MPTYQSDPVWATMGHMQDYKPIDKFKPTPQRGGNAVIPGSDELSLELLKQIFGDARGVGPMEGKRRLEMNRGKQRGNLGDYMGGKSKGGGQAPSSYAEAEKRLNDMLYMTGGYINPQRNMGDLYKYYHGFV